MGVKRRAPRLSDYRVGDLLRSEHGGAPQEVFEIVGRPIRVHGAIRCAVKYLGDPVQGECVPGYAVLPGAWFHYRPVVRLR
jgi:hypothetical protein